MPNPASVLALLLSLCLSFGAALPARAVTDPDLSHGAQLFSSNCAACHMGGGNVIRASRTLSLADLQAYLDSYNQHPIEAIENQIENGKNAMPSYEGKLSLTDIDDVAAYVEKQAEKGWSR
ncbi:c-type cytochrome [Synechococcus sp. UW179A]|uniref:c-type cytochrome n=1 Tax=Synechococcus sp. UW179A TaxID=2575510 RepID=UPI000E0FD475|nr:c-type cytochrome [Synechococcus sp. UW179A]